MNCKHSLQYMDKDGCIKCNPDHPKRTDTWSRGRANKIKAEKLAVEKEKIIKVGIHGDEWYPVYSIDEVEEVAKALLRTYLTNEASQPTINREFEACKVEVARILVRRELSENGQLSEAGEHYSRVLIQLQDS